MNHGSRNSTFRSDVPLALTPWTSFHAAVSASSAGDGSCSGSTTVAIICNDACTQDEYSRGRKVNIQELDVLGAAAPSLPCTQWRRGAELYEAHAQLQLTKPGNLKQHAPMLDNSITFSATEMLSFKAVTVRLQQRWLCTSTMA